MNVYSAKINNKLFAIHMYLYITFHDTENEHFYITFSCLQRQSISAVNLRHQTRTQGAPKDH